MGEGLCFLPPCGEGGRGGRMRGRKTVRKPRLFPLPDRPRRTLKPLLRRTLEGERVGMIPLSVRFAARELRRGAGVPHFMACLRGGGGDRGRGRRRRLSGRDCHEARALRGGTWRGRRTRLSKGRPGAFAAQGRVSYADSAGRGEAVEGRRRLAECPRVTPLFLVGQVELPDCGRGGRSPGPASTAGGPGRAVGGPSRGGGLRLAMSHRRRQASSPRRPVSKPTAHTRLALGRA